VGGRGQIPHLFSGEIYDFYSVSPEYFGYALVYTATRTKPEHSHDNIPDFVASQLNSYILNYGILMFTTIEYMDFNILT
jgi:hypothetical protein